MNFLVHDMIEKARLTRMSVQEREEQAISFAYANARIENPAVTREMARIAIGELIEQHAAGRARVRT